MKGLHYGNADFNARKTCRYSLSRYWDGDLDRIIFIGANPSIAGETEDDPTIRRIVNFAKSWGYGRMTILNVNSAISTDPKKIRSRKIRNGKENREKIESEFLYKHDICLCWGNLPKKRDVTAVLRLIKKTYKKEHRKKIFHLGLTLRGNPKHPLYLKADTKRVYEIPKGFYEKA